MGGKSGSRDWAVAELARRQHGTVAVWQLLQLGLSRREIERRVGSGRIHRVHRGVYAVGHVALSREGQLMAAVVACGPGAVLSHWSAAELWRLLEARHGVIDVSVLGHRRGVEGIRTHRLRELVPCERTRRHAIPVTSVPRTLFDLAAVATTRQLQRATNEAERGGWLNRRAVEELCVRHRGRKGIKEFQAVTAAVCPSTHRTRSDLEVDFLALCVRHRLPAPEVNARIEGFEVDMHWPGTRLIVELDGYEYHRTGAAFEADRRRDAHLQTKGYTVIRVTGAWLNADPDGVAATIRHLLSR
jgi:very-short-patch-repair endonuclease